jgi:cell division protein FtsZ
VREAVQEALKMSLFESNDISGARRILLKVSTATNDNELKTNELGEIIDYVGSIAKNASLIWGAGNDDTLDNAISVTLIASDFCDN